MKKSRNPRTSAKILSSYQKVGTKFVPPMLQNMRFDYISWSSHVMPELIWWDVLTDKTSHRFTAKVAEEIAEYFRGRDNRDHWWAFISDYSGLADEDANGLRLHMAKKDVLAEFTHGLADFLDLYPACPLSRLLDRPPVGIIDIGYLLRFEKRIAELQDKRSRNGVLVQAQAVYLGFLLDKLRVKRGLALADFPEVQHYPDSETSLRVGASICATVNMLAGNMLPKYAEDEWVQYFWQRSLELRPLDFRVLEDR